MPKMFQVVFFANTLIVNDEASSFIQMETIKEDPLENLESLVNSNRNSGRMDNVVPLEALLSDEDPEKMLVQYNQKQNRNKRLIEDADLFDALNEAENEPVVKRMAKKLDLDDEALEQMFKEFDMQDFKNEHMQIMRQRILAYNSKLVKKAMHKAGFRSGHKYTYDDLQRVHQILKLKVDKTRGLHYGLNLH